MPPLRRNRTLRYRFPSNDWISPSNLRNFLVGDHLVDYFLSNGDRPIVSYGNIFTRFGQVFEDNVITYLEKKFPFSIPRNLNAELTAKALNEDKIPIIYQGTVKSETKKIYGHPDLIVRGDYLNQIFEEIIHKDLIVSRAYYIVEIKSKKMNFTTTLDGIRNNDGSIKYYKAQCFMYQYCLNEMLSCEENRHPDIAFILSRMPGGNLNCFQTPAIINFRGRLDNYVPQLVWNALKIKRELIGKCEHYPEEIVDFDLVAEDLHPNMSVQYDKFEEKLNIAKEIGDLTLLFQVGPRQRQSAFERGIRSWKDPKCNAGVLGIAKAFQSNVDAIIEINRNLDGPASRVSRPFGDEIKEKEDILDVYLDFEVANDVFVDDFKMFPMANRISLIYLIGLGGTFQTGSWEYQPFLARDLLNKSREVLPRSEIQNFQRFVHHLNRLVSRSPSGTKLRIFHWGHAEVSWIKALKSRSTIRFDLDKIDFVDLCSQIRTHHFAVRGAFKYGLKEISAAMKENGMIESDWSDETGILSHWQALKEGNYDPILRYNEIDCKVMWEIVQYLRRFHSS